MLNNKCDEGVSWAVEKAWGKIEDAKKVEETVNEKVMVVLKVVEEKAVEKIPPPQTKMPSSTKPRKKASNENVGGDEVKKKLTDDEKKVTRVDEIGDEKMPKTEAVDEVKKNPTDEDFTRVDKIDDEKLPKTAPVKSPRSPVGLKYAVKGETGDEDADGKQNDEFMGLDKEESEVKPVLKSDDSMTHGKDLWKKVKDEQEEIH